MPSSETRNVWRRGLAQYPLASVCQYDGHICRRRTRHHVACVLLVPGSVGHNEFATVGGEEAMGDVDGDALLPFGGQTVDQ